MFVLKVSYLSLSICLHPYSLLPSSHCGYLWSLKLFVGKKWGEGQEEDQGITQISNMINSYIKGQNFSQNFYEQQFKQSQSHLCHSRDLQALCLTIWSVSWTDSYDSFVFLQHLCTGIASVFIFSLSNILLWGHVFGLFELYSFQFLTDLGLLSDHCSASWSLRLLLTLCWTSLKELGRQSLSMMLASWLWFHHLCSAEIYNWLLQLGKVKYPFRSPSQKG